jgi:ferredoxin
MNEAVRVIAESEVCIGSGSCVLLAPTVFDLDDDGSVSVLKPEVTGDEIELAETAADSCPAFALRLERGASG